MVRPLKLDKFPPSYKQFFITILSFLPYTRNCDSLKIKKQTHTQTECQLIFLQLSFPLLSNPGVASEIGIHSILRTWNSTDSVVGRGMPSFRAPGTGSCLTLGNDCAHVLTKQEILLGKGTRVESSRVREPRRTALPHGSQSRVLW